MSEPRRMCVGCKSSAPFITEEKFDVTICSNCGVVQSDNKLVAQPHIVDAPTRLVTAQSEHGCGPKGNVEGLNKIRILATQLNLSEAATDYAMSLHTRAYARAEFKYRHSTMKYAMCCACVYLAAREFDVTVTARMLSARAGVLTSDLLHMKDLLQRVLVVPDKRPDVTALVEPFLRNAPCCDVTFRNDCVSLVDCCRQTWVLEGRQPQAVVYASAYLLWKSRDVNKRRKVTYAAFAKAQGLRGVTSSLVQQRVAELEATLVTLARSLPWVCDVTATSVLHHLADILQYRSAVCVIANRTAEHADGAEVSAGDCDLSETVARAKRSADCSIVPISYKRARLNDCCDGNAPRRSELRCDTKSADFHLTSSRNLDDPMLTSSDLSPTELREYIGH